MVSKKLAPVPERAHLVDGGPDVTESMKTALLSL